MNLYLNEKLEIYITALIRRPVSYNTGNSKRCEFFRTEVVSHELSGNYVLNESKKMRLRLLINVRNKP